MALFIVRHQHKPDRCPATDPYMGATLLNHLSRPNVRKHGVKIQGEAVVRGEHTLYMIVESSDEAQVREFMQPFAMAGSLDVYPAATCAGSWRAAAVQLQCRPSIQTCPPWTQKRLASWPSREDWLFTVHIRSTARPPFPH